MVEPYFDKIYVEHDNEDMVNMFIDYTNYELHRYAN